MLVRDCYCVQRNNGLNATLFVTCTSLPSSPTNKLNVDIFLFNGNTFNIATVAGVEELRRKPSH